MSDINRICFKSFLAAVAAGVILGIINGGVTYLLLK